MTFNSLLYSPLSVVMAIIVSLMVYTQNPVLVIGALIVLAVLLYTVQSARNMLIMTVAYISLLTSSGWGERYESLTVYVSYPIVILLLFATYLLTYRENITQLKNDSKVAKLVSIYILYSMITLAIGIIGGHSVKYAFKEMMFIAFYAAAWIATFSLRSKKDIIIFLYSFITITFLTSIGYIVLTMKSADLLSIILDRIVTQQPHIAIFALPLILSTWLFKAPRSERLSAVLIFPVVLTMVIISQQRALWVAVFGSILLMIFISFFKEQFNMKLFYKAIMTMASVSAGLAIVVYFLDNLMLGSTLATMATRVETIGSIQYDASLSMRYEEIQRALVGWDSRFLFGTGLGSVISRVASFETFDVIDNGFAYIFWKQGIIGLILFLNFFILAIYYGLKVLFKGNDLQNKMIAGAIVVGFSGLFVVGLTNTSLILYRFTILWAVFLVILEKLYRYEFSS